MDTLIGMMQQLEKMSPSERQKTLDEARATCICGNCPSYDLCMAKGQELLFCLNRKSACVVTRKACLCPTCPVTPLMGLSHGYYCARGSEKEIRKIV